MSSDEIYEKNMIFANVEIQQGARRRTPPKNHKIKTGGFYRRLNNALFYLKNTMSKILYQNPPSRTRMKIMISRFPNRISALFPLAAFPTDKTQNTVQPRAFAKPGDFRRIMRYEIHIHPPFPSARQSGQAKN
jgi:hypothetical protein